MAAEGNLYDDFDEAFSEGGEEEEDESEGEEEPFDLAAALAGGGAVEGVVEGTRFGAGPAVPVARNFANILNIWSVERARCSWRRPTHV